MRPTKSILKIILLVAVVFQVLFMVKRVHNYPFMIYDMYSRPIDAKPAIAHYRIIADRDTLNLISLPKFQEGRIIRSLDIYRISLETDGGDPWMDALEARQAKWSWFSKVRSDRFLRNDPERVAEFPVWLHRHMEKHVTGNSIDSLLVEYVSFEPDTKDQTVIHVIIDS